MNTLLFIVNPAGRGGAGPAAWEVLKANLGDLVTPDNVRVTDHEGHARELAAAARGIGTLVAVGGDGTVGEVLSGLMAHDEPRPRLAILPAGTGNDMARQLGAFPLEASVAALREGRTKAYDIIRIDAQTLDGAAHRYAFLLSNVGFSAMSMLKPWMKRFLPTSFAFYLATVLETIRYQPGRMTIRWDDGEFTGPTWIVITCNAERVSGGSMRLAPGALMDDGRLNVSILPAHPKFRMLFRILPKLAKGTHVQDPWVKYFTTTKLEIESDRPVTVEVDGDVFASSPATLTLCPRAVQVVSREGLIEAPRHP